MAAHNNFAAEGVKKVLELGSMLCESKCSNMFDLGYVGGRLRNFMLIWVFNILVNFVHNTMPFSKY